jgi:hypothetical protein
VKQQQTQLAKTITEKRKASRKDYETTFWPDVTEDLSDLLVRFGDDYRNGAPWIQ